ncbi:MAG TPA: cation-transporting P-type ATPase [Gammaproteobacteria bacterium]|nr:cation-transporting P-type ATPase [Gammaproteobacteria bacterium]
MKQTDAPDLGHRGDGHHFAQAVETVLKGLSVDPERGLSAGEVRRRRRVYGPNRLLRTHGRPAKAILVDQFRSAVILVLAAAAALAVALGHNVEAAAILAVVVVNTAIGFFSEWRAVRSMEALRRMRRHRTRVRRDGRERDVPAEELVPGDVVLLNEGDLVPADCRVTKVEALQVDEASLTGESVPTGKGVDALPADTPLAERQNMVFKGTVVARGSGVGVVVRTGMRTELGRIVELAGDAKAEATPLEVRLDRLGRRLAWLVLSVAAVVVAVGLASGRDTVLMIETGIALGLAAIPEGLPIVSTLALARGMWLMARRHALVNRLSAVETLGATQVICTDKTGTLTENRMVLRSVVTAAGCRPVNADDQGSGWKDPVARRALEIGVLCSNAELAEDSDDHHPHGDPTELAILVAGRDGGLRRPTLLRDRPEEREVAFDPERMMMATYHRTREGPFDVAVKGAPSAVLAACDSARRADGSCTALTDNDREQWERRIAELASQGLRLLLVADKTADRSDVEPYRDLCLVGLLGLLDPPRDGVPESISDCRAAGIRVVMVTGDQPDTARAIAAHVGLGRGRDLRVMHGRELHSPSELSAAQEDRIAGCTVFARVTPEQKLRLVEILQGRGKIVAMTGDGVNDAPALKKADIGVAMGRRGTDAARQVADMVLQDDRFSTIVAAVRQGRVIFGNIRKSVMFMLCTNIAEVLSVAAATVLGMPLPLRPLQILYLNVLTDVFPALALGVGDGPEHIMEQPPRDPRESLVTRIHWLAIAGWSVLIAGCILFSLAGARSWLGLSETGAVTVSFLTLAFAKLWFVFNLRHPRSRFLRNEVLRNPWIWAANAVCTALLVATLYVPQLSAVLGTTALPAAGWGLLLGMSLVPVVIGQVALYAVSLYSIRRSQAFTRCRSR